MKYLLGLLPVMLLAGPPMINDLLPRGAQKGRPFKLAILGKDIGAEAKVHSTLPASFTPLAAEHGQKGAMFLVEPKGEIPVGVYPIRVETPDGISNVQLFTVGAFPELAEEESEPGQLPNRNDTMETAQPLPAANVTVNGQLRGAERDMFRVQAKAGEKRTFEVEARRCGSAIDPVIRVTDGQGLLIGRSEDALLAGLDARLEVTFPAAGYYYVEVHDARFSTQGANFYRLKSGQFSYPTEIFPLGGQRGTKTSVMISGTPVTADLGSSSFVNLPDAVTLPVQLAVGDYPEFVETAGRLAVPSVMNGRLTKPAEVDSYKVAVEPGQVLMFEMQARELGTSRISGVITVKDPTGKKLASAGDNSVLLGVNTVQFESRTSGDPYLRFVVPADVREITVSVEDLAERGGAGFGYRLITHVAPDEFDLTVNAPYVNIPAGGTVAVPVTIDRRGYNGPLQIKFPSLPKGLRADGGWIPGEAVDSVSGGSRSLSRRGMVVISAEPGVALPMTEIAVVGEAVLADGKTISRAAHEVGMAVSVNGATTQGVVDRQRPVMAPWLSNALPVAMTSAPTAWLEVSLDKRTMKGEGEEFIFRYKWKSRKMGVEWPAGLSVDLVNAADTRTVDFKADAADKSSGTFMMTTTRNTLPNKYDLYVVGRLMVNGQLEEIPARPIQIEVKEVPASEAVVTQ